MKQLLAAAVLAGFALAASAADDSTHAASADACPPGTYATVPSYKWKDGHFVQDGWVCESIYDTGN
jgi:hypothetical protein